MMSVAAAEGSDLSTVLAQLLSFVAIAFFTPEGAGETRGLVIENSDTYTGIDAKTALCLSSEGPVVLESSSSLVGDLEKTHPFHQSIPADLSKNEIGGGEDDFYKNQAVVMRSDLVRMLSEELGLEAKKTFAAKSVLGMQFLVGEGGQAPVSPEVPELAEIPLNLELQNVNRSRVAVQREDLDRGALFQTNVDGSPISIETREADSPIGLIQAKGLPAERSLTLDQDGAILKASDQLSLSLNRQGSPSTRLSASQSVFLSLEDGKAVLQQSDGSSATVTAEAITLQNPAGVSLECGDGAVQLQPAGVTFKGATVNAQAELINLG
jgi:hypothetical protein